MTDTPLSDSTPRLRKDLLFFMALVIGAVFLSTFLMKTRSSPERKAPPIQVPIVEVLEITPQDFQIWVPSQGSVEARTQITLLPEVSGKIIEVSSSFQVGGFFAKDELLLAIDPRDYQNAVTLAEAELAKARLKLAQEEAEAAQAIKDWKTLGQNEAPSALVLRKPQITEVKASVAAAEARLQQELRKLERTRIIAPFDGRILKKHADIGQVVGSGSLLATLFAIDVAEIRLPLSQEQMRLINLPENSSQATKPRVQLQSRSPGGNLVWQGVIDRTEGAIDSRSRQLFLIAQVIDPYCRKGATHPILQVGQYVEASIEGLALKQTLVIPAKALRENKEVIVITDTDQIEKRIVTLFWHNAEVALIEKGLQAGERICMTPLAYAVPGTPVQVLPSTPHETHSDKQSPLNTTAF